MSQPAPIPVPCEPVAPATNSVLGSPAERETKSNSRAGISSSLVCLLVLCWVAALSAGYHAMMMYAAIPGDQTSPVPAWRQNQVIVPQPGRWTIIMFAHPRCPCTRASLIEYAKILKIKETAVDPYVVFYRPSSAPPEWSKSDLWTFAEEIPGVTVIEDVDGVAAEHFEARCSGIVSLYDPEKQLRYHGGVTASRGHEGDSAGQEHITRLLKANPKDLSIRHASPASCSVFGCPLTSPSNQKLQ